MHHCSHSSLFACAPGPCLSQAARNGPFWVVVVGGGVEAVAGCDVYRLANVCRTGRGCSAAPDWPRRRTRWKLWVVCGGSSGGGSLCFISNCSSFWPPLTHTHTCSLSLHTIVPGGKHFSTVAVFRIDARAFLMKFYLSSAVCPSSVRVFVCI